MNPYSRMLRELQSKDTMQKLLSLYGSQSEGLVHQLTRYMHLIKAHEDLFETCDALYMISSPGRVEITGNHTDHQNGQVLACAVTLDMLAAVSPRKDNQICIHSEGFEPIEMTLDSLSMQREERGTSKALIRGVANAMKKGEYGIGGFDAIITSEVLPSSGLSSSAAFEMLICMIFQKLYNENLPEFDPIISAKICQYAENVYYGKPCGLMDQMASGIGGILAIDFKDEPQVTPLSFNFIDTGYLMILVNPPASQKDVVDEYTTIRSEMGKVASFFHEDTLRKVRPEQILQNLSALHKEVGDRATLRAMHYFKENIRVKTQLFNLKHNDLGAFFNDIIQSGLSSWTLLQNVYMPGENQPLSLALTVAAELLQDKGAWRVHGAGFAGTTLNFVPMDMRDEFISTMEEIFGANACLALDVRSEGTCLVLQN